MVGLQHEDMANDPVIISLQDGVTNAQVALCIACQETNAGDFTELSKLQILKAAKEYKLAWHALTLAVGEIIKKGQA